MSAGLVQPEFKNKKKLKQLELSKVRENEYPYTSVSINQSNHSPEQFTIHKLWHNNLIFNSLSESNNLCATDPQIKIIIGVQVTKHSISNLNVQNQKINKI